MMRECSDDRRGKVTDTIVPLAVFEYFSMLASAE
jgi:hypothetical protein